MSESAERLLNASDNENDQALDLALRPKSIKEYVGQGDIKESLSILIEAARKRKEPIDHLLLYGPPGLGKTTLAGVIAHETGASLSTTSGPAIERAGDLASILTNLGPNDVLFIDEIHRLPKTVEEILYPAMEDRKIDIILGKGPGARSVRLDLESFTIIGATTKIGALSSPLRDRFGATYQLAYYTDPEMEKIVKRSAKILGVKADAAAAKTLATRSRRTPRVANRLLKRARDWAETRGTGNITTDAAEASLKLEGVDELGLDAVDRRLLETIITKFKGGPVGLGTLAAATSEETEAIEDVYEPYLIQLGFLERTPRGRKATDAAYEHLGKQPPAGKQKLL
ncbi:Holliday junction branch migration DNA helicase RuvB [Patescibacteria group bacterium]|nr:Holliday junction branch migration DNA helicase RuvB [Patescibacteria group bacterium]